VTLLPMEQANRLKAEGNDAYNRSDYHGASELYRCALAPSEPFGPQAVTLLALRLQLRSGYGY